MLFSGLEKSTGVADMTHVHAQVTLLVRGEGRMKFVNGVKSGKVRLS